MKINLFTALVAAEILQDKESIEFKIQRVENEFTVMVVPKIADKKAVLTVTGTPEELDEGLMNELMKPIEKIKGLKSNADSVEIEDTTEKKEVKKPEPTVKKSDKKKADKKVESSTEEEKIEEEQNQYLETKKKFNQAMLDGENFYNERKYHEAENAYKLATELMPDNDKAKEAYEKTYKYVNALITAKIVPTREEYKQSKEVENGTEN